MGQVCCVKYIELRMKLYTVSSLIQGYNMKIQTISNRLHLSLVLTQKGNIYIVLNMCRYDDHMIMRSLNVVFGGRYFPMFSNGFFVCACMHACPYVRARMKIFSYPCIVKCSSGCVHLRSCSFAKAHYFQIGMLCLYVCGWVGVCVHSSVRVRYV